MKRIAFMALAATTLFLTSCSKKSKTDPQPTDQVTISGTAYATVKIGTQTWTAVNHNGAGGVNYNGSITNDATSGKLYTIAEAKAIVLPSGWRLPTAADFTKLYTSQGSDAKKLMAKTSWAINKGTNSSGFNALAVGYFEINSTPTYQGKGTDAVFITSSLLEGYNGIPACFAVGFDDDTVNDNTTISGVLSDYIVAASDKGSIRFVRDN